MTRLQGARRAASPPAGELPDPFPGLVLEAGGIRVAIPLEDVIEVIPRVHLFPVPGAPAWQAGVMQWRGEHVGVVDLGARWTGTSLPLRLEDRIVVLRQGGRGRGLLVEEVVGVERIPRAAAEMLAPGERGSRFVLAVARVGDRPLAIASLPDLLGTA